MEKDLKRRLSVVVFIFFICFVPSSVLATDQLDASLIEYDVYYSDDFGLWYPTTKNTIGSYIIDNKNNSWSIIEAVGAENGVVNILTYNKQKQLISEKNINYELSTFGAFYSGEQYNYIAFGQNNFEEDDNKEVIRIVRYDKNFNRIDSVSIRGGESFTIVPFDAGSGRMSEKDNELVFHTSRLRYLISDGLHHQSQLTITVNTSTMTVTNYLGEFQKNHVGHSFDQYVEFDGNEQVLIDHGDAYPRSIVLHKSSGLDFSEVDLFKIYLGAYTGDNFTGVSVGGFEISANNYIIALCSIDQATMFEFNLGRLSQQWDQRRDIILSVLPRTSLNENEGAFQVLCICEN